MTNDDFRSKSALGSSLSLHKMKENDPSSYAPTSALRRKKVSGLSPSKRSRRSGQSLLAHQYFNPVRFLAMQLFERNRDRK